MRCQPYVLSELQFAYCYHVYFRWHTHWRKANPHLRQITSKQLEAERPNIRILELEATDEEMALLASLQPTESVATAASKLKGATSKILRTMAADPRAAKFLGEGYFACTSGPITTDELDRYLEQQCQHHGYDKRAKPPVLVRTWPETPLADSTLQALHSYSLVR